MQILYDAKTDLLYIRLDDRKQELINRRVSEDIVLDVGENDKIVGIEILDASKHLNLERLLPVKYEVSPEAAQRMADEVILTQVSNRVARLTFNRPEKLNALS